MASDFGSIEIIHVVNAAHPGKFPFALYGYTVYGTIRSILYSRHYLAIETYRSRMMRLSRYALCEGSELRVDASLAHTAA